MGHGCVLACWSDLDEAGWVPKSMGCCWLADSVLPGLYWDYIAPLTHQTLDSSICCPTSFSLLLRAPAMLASLSVDV